MEQVLMREVQRWVAPRAAWVQARDGLLWVTRSGDLEDHLLRAGERLPVRRGDDLVLQSWRRDQPAVWDWQPRYRDEARLRGLPGWAARPVASFLRGAARVLDGLAARARSAAASASRPQGCIAAGESIASAGALQ